MVETTAHNHWPMAYAEARTIAIPLMRAMPSVCIYIASGIERGMERRYAIHDLSLGAARMDMESYSIFAKLLFSTFWCQGASVKTV